MSTTGPTTNSWKSSEPIYFTDEKLRSKKMEAKGHTARLESKSPYICFINSMIADGLKREKDLLQYLKMFST